MHHIESGQELIVCEHLDGRVDLLHGRALLPYRVFYPPRELHDAADDKTLNERVDRAVQRLEIRKPAPNHRWRRPIITRPSPSSLA